jgi:DNA-binding FrmR family transcriptional regulator
VALKRAETKTKTKKKKKKSKGHHHYGAHSQRLNRIVGQLQGIGRMLDEGRYCPDILIQTRAAMAAIKALEDALLEGHMEHCVAAAFQTRDPDDVKDKVGELMKLFRKRM